MDLPDHVAATSEEERKAGEGCYVSTTIHNRRYYGVLVDQATLKTASLLYFQDEASGLDLNRKMEYLIRKRRQDEIDYSNEEDDYITDLETQTKKPRLEVVSSSGNVATTPPTSFTNSRQVQKFRYVQSTGAGFKANSGYRLLLATFANVEAASEDDTEKLAEIELACRSGGNYVGKYFYQYEVCSLCFPFVSDVSLLTNCYSLKYRLNAPHCRYLIRRRELKIFTR